MYHVDIDENRCPRVKRSVDDDLVSFCYKNIKKINVGMEIIHIIFFGKMT